MKPFGIEEVGVLIGLGLLIALAVAETDVPKPQTSGEKAVLLIGNEVPAVDGFRVGVHPKTDSCISNYLKAHPGYNVRDVIISCKLRK